MITDHLLRTSPQGVEPICLASLKRRGAFLHQVEEDIFVLYLPRVDLEIILDSDVLREAIWEAHIILVCVAGHPADRLENRQN
jgi:hypothetical protein